MDSLLSSPIAAAVVIVAATITLVFLLKVLKGTMKLVATFVFVALIGLAVFQLRELGLFGF